MIVPSTRSAVRWVSALLFVSACDAAGGHAVAASASTTSAGTAPSAPADPATVAAHAALFAAADDLDLPAFKGRLSAESVALVDSAIAAGATLGRAPKASPLSWEDVLEAHRAISPAGRARTPYRLVPGSSPSRLDLTASPLGDLARQILASVRETP